ncbi:YitT family protein [Clostridium sp. Ade.TY]|uniref:YitT family protein n=1 Tax=Clostridium sp. Ade.TY TaxID=1391647 RepID=UPI0004A46A13|nr:YitT family protein [Clostridium sp. Ade.TY]
MLIVKENIKEYGIITIGVLLVAIAIEYFFAPNDIAAGGVSGLAVVITHYVPSLSVGSLTFIMNLFLFILAFIIVGGDFGFKTIYASFGLSFVLWFMDRFMHPEALTTDLMLATIFGTIITAIGLAIVFNINASTGGTDILAKILNKYTTFNMGIALLCVDFLVTLLGAITFGVDKGFYALLSVLINGPLIDKIIAFMNQKKQITIISSKNNEISSFIINELERGCTALAGAGVYSKEEKEIIYSVLNKKELDKVKEFIGKVDEEAFFTIGHVEEVQGKGFLKVSGL